MRMPRINPYSGWVPRVVCSCLFDIDIPSLLLESP